MKKKNDKKSLSEKILKKIKNEKIKPNSKYYYLALNIAKWSLFGLASIFGGMALSVMIYWLSDPDMIVSFKGLPFYWIALFCVFLALAYYDFKRTDSGYKYDFLKVILAEIVVVAVVGVALFGVGFAEKFESFSGRHMPFYRGVGDMKMMMWTRSDDGFLAGKVMALDRKRMGLELRAFDGEKWDVDFKDSEIDDRLQIEKMLGVLIKMRGDIVEDHFFKAEFLAPFGGRGMRSPPEFDGLPPPPLPLP